MLSIKVKKVVFDAITDHENYKNFPAFDKSELIENGSMKRLVGLHHPSFAPQLESTQTHATAYKPIGETYHGNSLGVHTARPNRINGRM